MIVDIIERILKPKEWIRSSRQRIINETSIRLLPENTNIFGNNLCPRYNSSGYVDLWIKPFLFKNKIQGGFWVA